MSREEVDMKLNQVYRFLKSKRSTVRGNQIARAKTIRSLQQAGFTGINKRNLKAFGEFMDKIRAANLDAIYTSDEIVDMFELFEKKGIKDKESLIGDLDSFYDKKQELEKIRKPRDSKKRTAE
mgnify:FL=1